MEISIYIGRNKTNNKEKKLYRIYVKSLDTTSNEFLCICFVQSPLNIKCGIHFFDSMVIGM